MALIIKRAETREEIEAAQRLAQEVYVEELNFVDMNDFKRAYCGMFSDKSPNPK